MSCSHAGKGERRDLTSETHSTQKQFDGFNTDGTQKEREILTITKHFKVSCMGCGASLRDDSEFQNISI